MRLTLNEEYADFAHGRTLAGRYRYQDAFKPHVHPLNTPGGITLSLRSPHDHPHHKGLMFALRASDVNFWEERPTSKGEKCGRQRHDGFTGIVPEGVEVGVEERLTWLAEDGSLETFRERRSLRCRFTDAALPAFDWEWTSELVALRDVALTVSPWSVSDGNGRPVNYHGLGLRLRRDFGCTGGNLLLLDGEPAPFARGLGARPRDAAFIGSVDDTSPVRRAGVRFANADASAFFILESPFAFISTGPTVLGGLELAAGQVLKTACRVSAFDDWDG